MARLKYRPYDENLNRRDVEVLTDVDEYYPDIVKAFDQVSEPQIFITSWLLDPQIQLTANLTFMRLLVRELQKPNAKVYILWNTNYKGTPFPQLRSIAKKFHRNATRSAGVDPTKLKIILSTNSRFDPPTLSLSLQSTLALSRLRSLGRDNPDNITPPSETEFFEELWLRRFPANPEQFKNLAVWTLGSHHQKTVTILDRSGSHGAMLHAYCGGIDFSKGPAGYQSGVYHGGIWWHDLAMRVRGKAAIPVLKNFVERWDEDLSGVNEGATLAFGVNTNDSLDINELTEGVEGGPIPDTLKSARTMPLGGYDFPLGLERITETIDVYKEWIPQAESHIFIINQYFRHQEIAELLVSRLEEAPALRLTIVMPSYSEEMGSRRDLVQIRDKFAHPNSVSEQREALLRAIAKSFSIDPLNKLTLYVQTKSIAELIFSPKVRVWIPRPFARGKVRGTPYIHAKMLAVDDKMLMIGSANVNGRSLDGLADSEMNLVLLDSTEIQRLLNTHGWYSEPENEESAEYSESWYSQHNLVRYTPGHWQIDSEYGRFPVGRNELLEYIDKFRSDGRVADLGLSNSSEDIAALLDSAPIDLSGVDWGELLANSSSHLL